MALKVVYLDDSTGQLTAALPSGAGTPTLVPAGDTYTVPLNQQVLLVYPILVDGDIVLEGDVVMFDV